MLKDPVIEEIAASKGKSPAQITLRWHVQMGLIPLVKTSKIERLTENISLYDFELTEEEMAKIDALDQNMRLYNPINFGGSWGNMPYFGD